MTTQTLGIRTASLIRVNFVDDDAEPESFGRVKREMDMFRDFITMHYVLDDQSRIKHSDPTGRPSIPTQASDKPPGSGSPSDFPQQRGPVGIAQQVADGRQAVERMPLASLRKNSPLEMVLQVSSVLVPAVTAAVYTMNKVNAARENWARADEARLNVELKQCDVEERRARLSVARAQAATNTEHYQELRKRIQAQAREDALERRKRHHSFLEALQDSSDEMEREVLAAFAERQESEATKGTSAILGLVETTDLAVSRLAEIVIEDDTDRRDP